MAFLKSERCPIPACQKFGLKNPSADFSKLSEKFLSQIVQVFLIFMICRGFYLRVLDFQNILITHEDHVFHILIAEKANAFEVIKKCFLHTVHPPLYLLFLHYFLNTFSDPSLIFLSSAVLGATFLYLIFLLVKLYSKSNYAALFATSVCVQAEYLILFSREIRVYSMQLCIIALMLICLLIYDEKKRLIYLALYAFLSLLGVFLQYATLIPIFCIFVVCSFSFYKSERQRFCFWLIAHMLMAAVATSFVAAHLEFGGFSMAYTGPVFERFYMPKAGLIATIERMYNSFFYFYALEILGKGLLLILAALSFFALCRSASSKYLLISYFVVLLSIVLCYFNLHPFSPHRNSAYLIPFLILPLASAFHVLEVKILQSKFKLALLLLIIPNLMLGNSANRAYVGEIKKHDFYDLALHLSRYKEQNALVLHPFPLQGAVRQFPNMKVRAFSAIRENKKLNKSQLDKLVVKITRLALERKESSKAINFLYKLHLLNRVFFYYCPTTTSKCRKELVEFAKIFEIAEIKNVFQVAEDLDSSTLQRKNLVFRTESLRLFQIEGG